jgi:hypothetical protein
MFWLRIKTRTVLSSTAVGEILPTRISIEVVEEVEVEVVVVAEGVVDAVDGVLVLRLSKHTNRYQNPRERERHPLGGSLLEDVHLLLALIRFLGVHRLGTHE